MKNINLKTVSFAGASLGLVGLVRTIVFDTAPEGTHNIGLMQVQMLWAQFSSTMLIAAAVLFVGNHLAGVMVAKTTPEDR
jgi:hypothetical protein